MAEQGDAPKYGGGVGATPLILSTWEALRIIQARREQINGGDPAWDFPDEVVAGLAPGADVEALLVWELKTRTGDYPIGVVRVPGEGGLYPHRDLRVLPRTYDEIVRPNREGGVSYAGADEWLNKAPDTYSALMKGEAAKAGSGGIRDITA
jgi:hypothetical protein